MTRTSNSSPADGTRATREETEGGEELVSSTCEGISFAEVNDGDGPMDDTEAISAFLGRRERAESEMTNVPQPSSAAQSHSAAVKGGTSTSSASAGVCLANDDERPTDIAQISAALEQQELAGKGEAKRVERPSSTSRSARVCVAEDSEGPMDIAQISATLEQQDRAEKAEAKGINLMTSSAATPPLRSASSVSFSRRESSARAAQHSMAETNLAASARELTIPMAEAYTVPDSPVFTASIVEVIPWYKQKRYVCILMMVMIMLIVIATVAGVILVGGKQPPDEVEMVEITSIIYVNVTDGPTETPTGQPTTIPSSEPSYLTTYSPTVHVCAAPIGQAHSVTPSANLCGTTVMQPTFVDTSHECNCTDSPAVIVNGTGVEFNLNSFAIACIAGSQPVIVIGGKSNSVLGRQTKQTSGERTGARGGICGSQATQIKILLQGSGNHTVRDLIVVLSDDSSLDQVGVQMESSGNTVDNCDIGSSFTPNPMSDSDPGNQVGVEMKGDNNVLSNNYISVRKDLADNYWTKTMGVRSFGNDCLIIGNTISDGSDGIFIEDANSLVVSTMTNDGINLIRSAFTSISGNSIQNCGVVAIHLKDSSHVTVKDNTLVDSKWGVLSSNATSLAISYNRISNMKEDGIQLKDTASSSIIGNSINNCVDDAISLFGSSDVTVEDNTLVNSDWGIYSENSTPLDISNNTIMNMSEDGIELQSSNSSSISGNSINNCGDLAISLFYSSNITVENNTLLEGQYGIFSEDATSLIVRNNMISNITDDAMHFRRSYSSSISGNLIQNCADKAIALFTLTDVTVENNTLMDSIWGVWSNNATSLVVSNNIISNASITGIFLKDAASSSVSGNSINNCEDAAISLFDSSYVTVENSTLVDSAWGIVTSYATSLAIRNNKINNTSLTGIYLKDAALSSISGNQIQNCDAAITLSRSSNVTSMVNTLVNNKWGVYSINSTFLVVENNNISDNSHIGIILRNMSFADIRGNIVNDNEAVGILLLESGLDTKIFNNTVNGNDGGGIILTGSDDTLIAGNILDSNKGHGISLCVEGFTVDGAGANNELIDNVITASTNASEIYIGEECVETVLKGNMAADKEDDQLLIDNQSPTTFISSDNVPNFAFTLVGPGHCQDSLFQLYDFATFVLENTTLAECEVACGNYDKTDNLVGFEVCSSACLCLFENDYLSSETPGIFGTCPGSADQCSITGTDGSGAVVSSLPAEDDRHCYKKTNYVKTDVFT